MCAKLPQERKPLPEAHIPCMGLTCCCQPSSKHRLAWCQPGLAPASELGPCGLADPSPEASERTLPQKGSWIAHAPGKYWVDEAAHHHHHWRTRKQPQKSKSGPQSRSSCRWSRCISNCPWAHLFLSHFWRIGWGQENEFLLAKHGNAQDSFPWQSNKTATCQSQVARHAKPISH